MGTDIGRKFEAYQRSSYTERLREQLARRAEAGTAPMAPVVIYVSRAQGEAEFLRRYMADWDAVTGEPADLEAQGEELRRLHELMEPVVQSMAEQAWQTELTALELKPETLTRLVREMEKGRSGQATRPEMEFPYLMPLPLEKPVYELDLAETCPVCGGAKHRGEGVCGRCLL